jgi:ubiquitin carboxyl-terminal hydrolase 7
LDENADKSKPWVYRLHGVLVHSGDLHGGHYFALIKPDRETRWLKFDDDRVTPVTDREVLEENFGGEPLNGIHLPNVQRNQVRQMKRFTNAYMLVYVRESAIDEVLAPFKEEDTPAHLSTYAPFNVCGMSRTFSVQNVGLTRNECKSRPREKNAKNNICS